MNRYLVRFYSGRTVIASRRVRSYRHARALASGVLHYRATIRPLLTESEARALVCLIAVAVAAVAYVQLGA